jgi:hypothetical protein
VTNIVEAPYSISRTPGLCNLRQSSVAFPRHPVSYNGMRNPCLDTCLAKHRKDHFVTVGTISARVTAIRNAECRLGNQLQGQRLQHRTSAQVFALIIGRNERNF